MTLIMAPFGAPFGALRRGAHGRDVVASVMEGYPRLDHGGNGGGLHPLHYPLPRGLHMGPH